MVGIIRAVFDGKKPYNPVMGETCAWAFDHKCERAGVSKMICEQVISGWCAASRALLRFF